MLTASTVWCSTLAAHRTCFAHVNFSYYASTFFAVMQCTILWRWHPPVPFWGVVLYEPHVAQRCKRNSGIVRTLPSVTTWEPIHDHVGSGQSCGLVTRGQFGKKKSACGNGDLNWVTLALFFSDRMSHLSNFRSANDFLLLLGSAMEVVKLFGSCVGCWPNDCFDQSDHHDSLLHAGLRDGNTLRII